MLTGNQIGDAGATQLAHSLGRNSTLTVLDLRGKHKKISNPLIILLLFIIINYYYILLLIGLIII